MPVGVLTASVDVQGDRLELLVKGWGEGQESWLITHQRLHGDPDLPDVWARLETLLTKAYEHESGARLWVQSAAIDAGYKTDRVYDFVRSREGRGVFALKGNDTRARELLTRPTRKNKLKVKPVTIATYSFKDMVFSRLKTKSPGPRYMHFPLPQEGVEGIDANYFQQFAGEAPIGQRDKRGVVRRIYKTVGRNEAIDLEVYALAALYVLGPAVFDHLPDYVAAVKEAGERARAKEVEQEGEGAENDMAEQSEPRPIGRKATRRRSNWATSW